MFTLDWNDPQTFWLNVTNVILAAVTVISLALVLYSAVRELLARAYRRSGILARETPAHSAAVPELGLTMADGGLPIDTNKPGRRAPRARR